MKPFSIHTDFRPSRAVVAACLLVCLALLAGCGAGGDSADSESTTSVQYTGKTDAAPLTSENTKTLISESYQGILIGQQLSSVSGVTARSQKESAHTFSNPLALGLQAAFADSLSDMLASSRNSAVKNADRTIPLSHQVDGQCGGDASFSLSIDETSGLFSGSVTYATYCSGDVTLSGSVTVSGMVATSSLAIEYFSFAFTNLVTTADGVSMGINGTLECDFQGDGMIITTDMLMEHSVDGSVCWLNDYTIQISGSQMEISGRFYDPVFGFVNFITTTPLALTGLGVLPTAGAIAYAGGFGTSAILTVESATTCRITADTSGDGTSDYDAGQITWSDM